MAEFNSLLKKYIKEQKLTIYTMAKETNGNRSFLQGILAGKKKLPEKRFDDIVSPRYFTSEQIAELTRAYYEEKYSKEKVKSFALIEQGLSGKFLKKLQAPVTYRECEPKPNNSYAGKNNILSLIYTVLKHSDGNVQTNFSFARQEEIGAVFYNLFCESGGGLVHFINEQALNRADKIKALFYAHHFAEIGVRTYYCSDFNSIGAIFPYFIVTGRYCLHFDEELQNALLLDKSSVGSIYDKKFEQMKSECRQPVEIIDNAMHIMEYLQVKSANEQHDHIYGFDGTFCPTFINERIIDAIATPIAKNIPNISQQISCHYSTIINDSGKVDLIINYNAVKDFCETGRIYSYPQVLAGNVPSEMRREMILPLIENESFDFRITNPEIFSTDYIFTFQINDNVLLTESIISGAGDNAFLGDVSAAFSDKELCEDFIDFCRFYVHTQGCYTKKASIDFLKNFIAKID